MAALAVPAHAYHAPRRGRWPTFTIVLLLHGLALYLLATQRTSLLTEPVPAPALRLVELLPDRPPALPIRPPKPEPVVEVSGGAPAPAISPAPQARAPARPDAPTAAPRAPDRTIVPTATPAQTAAMQAGGGTADAGISGAATADGGKGPGSGNGIGKGVGPGQGWALKRAEWVEMMSYRELRRYHPKAALRAGIGGHVTLFCHVLLTKRVRDCWVNRETPSGAGFGEAALRASAKFLVHPRRIDGAAVDGALVFIPIRFDP